jgi:hypothetical protein
MSLPYSGPPGHTVKIVATAAVIFLVVTEPQVAFFCTTTPHVDDSVIVAKTIIIISFNSN